MLVPDVISLIVSDLLGVEGTNLFGGLLPDQPDLCICVSEHRGYEGVGFFGEPYPAIERPRLMVRVRGAKNDYATPRALIQQISNALANRGAVVVSGTRYLAFTPVQPPEAAGRDENDRWVFAVNFEVTKGPS